MTSPRPVVHLVEDDRAVSDSLMAVLEAWGFAAAAFPDAERYLAEGIDDAADCLLVDIRLPGIDGLGLVETLRLRGLGTPVIVITGHADLALAVGALRAGAQDFLEKPFEPEDLVSRIGRLVPARPEGPCWLDALTPREREVMIEVVAGLSNRAIADKLGVSPRTVEIHRARVMEKSGAESLSHLVRLALKAGIDPDRV